MALVLSNLFGPIQGNLAKCAEARQKSRKYVDTNNDVGGVCDPFAFVDDAYVVPVPKDAEWLMDKIARLSSNFGALINTDKTSMLTGNARVPVVDLVPCPDNCRLLEKLL